jgi:hypothetical protein
LGGGPASSRDSAANDWDPNRSSHGSGAGYRTNGAGTRSRFSSRSSKFDDDASDKYDWTADADHDQGGR